MYKPIYTREMILENFRKFIEKYGHEPSAIECTSQVGIPRKTIERRFGGLKSIRKELGLYQDHTKGIKRKEKADIINKRAIEWNSKVYKKLLTLFEESKIHQESSIFDDRRNRTDFKVYGKKIFLVDIFYPATLHSLGGCIRLKANKYPVNLRDYVGSKYDKVIFLNLNSDLDISSTNITIPNFITVMNLDEFWKYCQTML